MKTTRIITLLLAFVSLVKVNAQKSFYRLDSLLSYATAKSTTLKTGYLKLDQAKKAKLVAIYGVFDLNASATFNITNNTRLPVSLFPAEAFGGQPGTYTEVQTGIQYNSTANINGELKLLNVAGWQNLKLAKVNLESAGIESQLTKKQLYENIANTYYNIVSLHEQLKTAELSMQSADTLFHIVSNKYQKGLAKQQDVNSAKVSFINAEESVNQLKYILKQQYISLKILCDIPETEDVVINYSATEEDTKVNNTADNNKLKLSSTMLREKISYNYYKQQKYTLLPTISVFGSNSNQQFSTEFQTFDKDARWINSNYIGIKAVLMLPSANVITQVSKAKYEYLMAKESSTHALNESNLEFSKLNVDYLKSVSQYTSNKEVLTLQKDSYYKNLDLYKQGLMGLDLLLTSFNSLIASEYNYNSALANVLLTLSKIDINNKIK